MNKFSEQFAIINKIKNLVQKTGSSIFKPKKDFGISEDIAKKIQKSAYDLSHSIVKDSCTPPYIIIAEQLQVEDDQIFRAAVYYLANIAINEPIYTRDIIKYLQDAKTNKARTPEQKEYLDKKINFVQNHI